MSQIDTKVIHKMKLSPKDFVQVSHEDAKEFETVKLESYHAIMNRGQLERFRDLLDGICQKMKP